jgi:CubicO group peptidase (beta-lactamase class C family)
MPAAFVLLVAVLLSPSQAMDAYIQPYVQTKNFSGAVRLECGERIIFQRAYAKAAPNAPYDGEEHSANILALTIEQRTGMAFAPAMQTLLFEPLGLRNSGEDDDMAADATPALGYQAKGIDDVVAAPKIYWSAKSGNGSAYTTVGDEARWLEELFSGRALSAQSLR